MKTNHCIYHDICPVIKSNMDQDVPMVGDGFIGEFKDFHLNATDINDKKPIVLMIGEAPATEEEQLLTPFVGKAGKVLRKSLYDAGFFNTFNVVLTNAVKCRPIDIENNKNFRTPTNEEISYCVTNNLSDLYKNIILTPDLLWTHKNRGPAFLNNLYVILLGSSAIKAQIAFAGQENIVKASSKTPIDTKANIGELIKYKYITNVNLNSINVQILTYIAYHPVFYARNPLNINEYDTCFSKIYSSIKETKNKFPQ